LVLGLGLLRWISLIVILLTAAEVYDRARPATSHRRAADIAFLVVLSAFLGQPSIGVLRRWRRTFWLILTAFLRLPGLASREVGGLVPYGSNCFMLLKLMP